MERFILINNERNRIKVFEPFEDVSKQLGRNTNNYWMRDGRKQVSSGAISRH